MQRCLGDLPPLKGQIKVRKTPGEIPDSHPLERQARKAAGEIPESHPLERQAAAQRGPDVPSQRDLQEMRELQELRDIQEMQCIEIMRDLERRGDIQGMQEFQEWIAFQEHQALMELQEFEAMENAERMHGGCGMEDIQRMQEMQEHHFIHQMQELDRMQDMKGIPQAKFFSPPQTRVILKEEPRSLSHPGVSAQTGLRRAKQGPALLAPPKHEEFVHFPTEGASRMAGRKAMPPPHMGPMGMMPPTHMGPKGMMPPSHMGPKGMMPMQPNRMPFEMGPFGQMPLQAYPVSMEGPYPPLGAERLYDMPPPMAPPQPAPLPVGAHLAPLCLEKEKKKAKKAKKSKEKKEKKTKGRPSTVPPETEQLSPEQQKLKEELAVFCPSRSPPKPLKAEKLTITPKWERADPLLGNASAQKSMPPHASFDDMVKPFKTTVTGPATPIEQVPLRPKWEERKPLGSPVLSQDKTRPIKSAPQASATAAESAPLKPKWEQSRPLSSIGTKAGVTTHKVETFLKPTPAELVPLKPKWEQKAPLPQVKPTAASAKKETEKKSPTADKKQHGAAKKKDKIKKKPAPIEYEATDDDVSELEYDYFFSPDPEMRMRMEQAGEAVSTGTPATSKDPAKPRSARDIEEDMLEVRNLDRIQAPTNTSQQIGRMQDDFNDNSSISLATTKSEDKPIHSDDERVILPPKKVQSPAQPKTENRKLIESMKEYVTEIAATPPPTPPATPPPEIVAHTTIETRQVEETEAEIKEVEENEKEKKEIAFEYEPSDDEVSNREIKISEENEKENKETGVEYEPSDDEVSDLEIEISEENEKEKKKTGVEYEPSDDEVSNREIEVTEEDEKEKKETGVEYEPSDDEVSDLQYEESADEVSESKVKVEEAPPPALSEKPVNDVLKHVQAPPPAPEAPKSGIAAGKNQKIEDEDDGKGFICRSLWTAIMAAPSYDELDEIKPKPKPKPKPPVDSEAKRLAIEDIKSTLGKLLPHLEQGAKKPDEQQASPQRVHAINEKAKRAILEIAEKEKCWDIIVESDTAPSSGDEEDVGQVKASVDGTAKPNKGWDIIIESSSESEYELEEAQATIVKPVTKNAEPGKVPTAEKITKQTAPKKDTWEVDIDESDDESDDGVFAVKSVYPNYEDVMKGEDFVRQRSACRDYQKYAALKAPAVKPETMGSGQKKTSVAAVIPPGPKPQTVIPATQGKQKAGQIVPTKTAVPASKVQPGIAAKQAQLKPEAPRKVIRYTTTLPVRRRPVPSAKVHVESAPKPAQPLPAAPLKGILKSPTKTTVTSYANATAQAGEKKTKADKSVHFEGIKPTSPEKVVQNVKIYEEPKKEGAEKNEKVKIASKTENEPVPPVCSAPIPTTSIEAYTSTKEEAEKKRKLKLPPRQLRSLSHRPCLLQCKLLQLKPPPTPCPLEWTQLPGL